MEKEIAKTIEERISKQNFFFLTRNGDFDNTNAFRIFLEEPEIDIYDDGTVYWVCETDSLFWNGIAIPTDLLFCLKTEYKDPTSYAAKKTKIYQSLKSVLDRLDCTILAEEITHNGKTKYKATLAKKKDEDTEPSKH